MVWPLEPEGARRFCTGLEDVLVIEEKRALLEEQLARILYNEGVRPRLLGKRDERGAPLVPSRANSRPARSPAIAAWLPCRGPRPRRRRARAGAVASVSAR